MNFGVLAQHDGDGGDVLSCEELAEGIAQLRLAAAETSSSPSSPRGGEGGDASAADDGSFIHCARDVILWRDDEATFGTKQSLESIVDVLTAAADQQQQQDDAAADAAGEDAKEEGGETSSSLGQSSGAIDTWGIAVDDLKEVLGEGESTAVASSLLGGLVDRVTQAVMERVLPDVCCASKTARLGVKLERAFVIRLKGGETLPEGTHIDGASLTVNLCLGGSGSDDVNRADVDDPPTTAEEEGPPPKMPPPPWRSAAWSENAAPPKTPPPPPSGPAAAPLGAPPAGPPRPPGASPPHAAAGMPPLPKGPPPFVGMMMPPPPHGGGTGTKRSDFQTPLVTPLGGLYLDDSKDAPLIGGPCTRRDEEAALIAPGGLPGADCFVVQMDDKDEEEDRDGLGTMPTGTGPSFVSLPRFARRRPPPDRSSLGLFGRAVATKAGKKQRLNIPHRAGQAIVHDSLLPHGALPCRIGTDRFSLLLWFACDEQFEQFPGLPSRPKVTVLSFLELREFVAASQTSKGVNKLSRSNALWKRLFRDEIVEPTKRWIMLTNNHRGGHVVLPPPLLAVDEQLGDTATLAEFYRSDSAWESLAERHAKTWRELFIESATQFGERCVQAAENKRTRLIADVAFAEYRARMPVKMSMQMQQEIRREDALRISSLEDHYRALRPRPATELVRAAVGRPSERRSPLFARIAGVSPPPSLPAGVQWDKWNV